MTKAVVFDLYGTILAIDAVRAQAEEAGASDPRAFVDAWRRKQLEYAFLCSLAHAYRDFDELTALALDQTCAAFGVPLDVIARSRLASAWMTLPAYPDVEPALRELQARGIPAAVLTNGKPESAHEALRNAGVHGLLVDVLSVDTVRSYKPDPRVYALATARFDCAPAQIAFVSSNPWDAWGAAHFGFSVAWCNRSGATGETLTPAPRTQLRDLSELEAFMAGLS